MAKSEAAAPTYSSLEEMRPLEVWPGRSVCRVVRGKDVMLAICDVAANVDIPEHKHTNEQIGFVILGTITYIIGGDEKLLKPGDTYTIPSDVPHSASTGPNGATVVDIFAPPRADWDQVNRVDPYPPAWP